MYFKGLTADRGAEATITATLAAELPESFARTLALERRSDDSTWWLTEHCGGTTVAADVTPEPLLRVAASLGRIQRHVSDQAIGLAVPNIDLAALAAWVRLRLVDHASPETVDRCDGVLAGA